MLLNQNELRVLSEYISETLVGARLQDILLTTEVLWLGHYKKGPLNLGVALQMNQPSIGLIFDEPKKQKGLTKPLVLFLRAHFMDKILHSVSVREDLGRVVELSYGKESESKIEIHLIPRSFNIILKTKDKKLSLLPPRELPPPSDFQAPDKVFDIENYLSLWEKEINLKSKNSPRQKEIDPVDRLRVLLEKKTKALESLKEEQKKLEKSPHGNVGEWIKANQTLDVPDDWQEFVDETKTLPENLEILFSQQKNQKRKLEGNIERQEKLSQELVTLQAGDLPPLPNKKVDILKKAAASGRRLNLNDKVEAIIGKSAADNLAILRRAQPWDLWLHLKDFPGAHAIVHRPRNTNVTHEDLRKVALWTLEATLKKRKPQRGEKYDFIYTECRYVKPLKGDRLGRVTYQNANTLTFRVD